MSNDQNTKFIRYSDEDLQEFKRLIEDKLQNAKEELEFVKEQIIELNENGSEQQGGDWVDDSSVYAELEMLNRMAERQQKFVQSLESALVRIGNKTYGICSVTGKLIDKKRLLLVPHATKTVEGKEQEKVVDERKPAPSERANRQKDDEDGDDEEVEPKKAATPKTPKIITKIVRKPTAAAAKKPVKDDDDDLDKDLGGDDYDDDVLGIDLDDIADDDAQDPSDDSQDNW